MRAIWKGTISFGLVSIPVRLAPATTDRDVHFRTLHRRCLTPIQYRKWCPTCNIEVPPEELVYGHEFQPGQFLPVEESDLQSLRAAGNGHTIGLLDFVSLAEIDPIYFEKTYYLEPGEGGLRPYVLLHQTLQATTRIGIGSFTLRTKESLAALRVYGPILALTTLFYPDEIRPLQELSGLSQLMEANAPTTSPAAAARGGDGHLLPSPRSQRGQPVALDPRELEMARNLVDSLTVPFDPNRYTSAYRERLEAWLQDKLAQVPPSTAPAPAAAKGQVIDLMQALEASLAAARRRQQTSATPATPTSG
ncbi:MAG: Ku protein [Limnochordaceae bacterium]|nr:Ku protein [Limnochordaceae bacterium]